MKVVFSIVIALVPIFAYSQTYRNAYDSYEYFGGNHGNGFSFDINITKAGSKHNMANAEPAYLEGNLNLYLATKDKKYLDKFIIHTIRIQNHRNDALNYSQNMQGVTGSSCSPRAMDSKGLPVKLIPDIDGYPQSSSVFAWSCDEDNAACDGWYTRALHSGNLTYPMAKFIDLILIQAYSELHNIPVPDEALSPTANSDGYVINNYGDFANWLRFKVSQTLKFHLDNHWYVISGQEGLWSTDIHPSHIDEINMQCAFGRALAYMYKVENLPGGNNALASIYLEKLSKISQLVRSQLQINNYDNSAYTWSGDYGTCIEDIAHAYMVMDFAHICHQNNIPDFYSPSNKLFWATDMGLFANTFSRHIFASPLSFATNVFGSSINNCSAGITVTNISHYTFLSMYNKQIYQQISDYFCEGALLNGEKDLVGFSQLELYKNLFNPIALKRNNISNIGYAGASSGDFDGDGSVNIASIDNSSNQIKIYSVNPDNSISTSYSYQLATGTWAGIASGDFNISHNGAELFTVDKNTGNIYYAELSGGVFTTLINSIGTSGWSGIASGNVDGNIGDEAITISSTGEVYFLYYNTGSVQKIYKGNIGISQLAGLCVSDVDVNSPGDEIITVDNNSGYVKILKYNSQNNTFSTLYQYTATAGSYNLWNGLSIGDFDGDEVKEIIAHRNYDGQFLVFKIKNGALVNGNGQGEFFPISEQQGVMASARLANAPQSDALVTFRNYDGQITAFNMNGLCPSLALSNVSIDANTSIDNQYTNISNNYNIDYHANNTLYSSNFVIVGDGSKVDFVAGKKVVLQPGFNAKAGSNFHAYIDNSIYCSNPSFRTKNNDTENKEVETKNIRGSKSDILIMPNPSSGEFYVKFAVPNKNSCDVNVYDVSGKLVFKQLCNLNENNNELKVNLKGVMPGIYFINITDKERSYSDKIIITD